MEKTVLSKIKNEHRHLFKLLDDIEQSLDYFHRLELFNRLKEELVAHIDSEEKTIYLRLRSSADSKVATLINTSDQEHHEMKEYLQRLNLINFGSKDWLEALTLLKSSVKMHSLREEIELFSDAKEEFSNEELTEIACDYEAAKHIAN